MSTASTIEQEMLALINAERTSRGLNPLQLERQLNQSSEDHSSWMLNTDTFSHTGSGGSTATQRMQAAGFDLEGSWRTGENIAWQSERGAPGISDDVAQLHQNLMNSPGHRANILNPDFKYIGIGVETGDMQGFNAVMVTQNFATTDAAVMLDNGNAPVPPAPTPPVDEVAEPEQPAPETPDTGVTQPEEPVAETPDTEVSEPEAPGTETPDTDVVETEEPGTETPGVEEPDSGCFDVAAFLAELDAFIDALQARFDQFDWNDDDMTTADTAGDDMDIVSGEDTDPVEDTVGACSGAAGEDDGDTDMFNVFDWGCMMEAA